MGSAVPKRPIGHFEAAARRRRAWLTLYDAGEQYARACGILASESKPDGSFVDRGAALAFEEAYLTLELGVRQVRRLQGKRPPYGFARLRRTSA